ncbi:MAG: heparinase II/III-family protein [Clostridiales bacterium]|nr:heparinase II/III-family protein [Clostridiales bacterium]
MFSLAETTGNRLAYEQVYFQRRKYLAVYGGLAVVQKHPDRPEKLEEVIRNICGEECWALPAHVDRAGNPDWRRTVDLFAAETGQALAQILALTGDRLDPDVGELIRNQVTERVLTPYLESEPPYLPWEGADNNWNAVCAGSLGCIGICLLSGQPEAAPTLEKLLDRVLCSLEHYIDGFGDDGACMEGLTYFSYGFCYYVGFAELLYRHTKGKIDLLRQDKVRKIARFQQKCYFPSGCTLSFSDGSCADRYRLGLTCALAMRYPEVEIPPASCAGGFGTDWCYRFLAVCQDVVWTRRYLEELDGDLAADGLEGETSADIPPYIVLPDAQWSIARGASGGGMVCRGGTNGEPHNHNDVGSFLYLLGDEMLLADLGAGEYTRQYFSEDERYLILCNRSLGHNVPLIDGEEQRAGAQYRCDSFWSDGRGRTVIRFASAYGNKAARDLTRTLEYDADTERLTVEDVLELQRPDTAKGGRVPGMRENLVTEAPPLVEGNRILVCGERRCCRITVEGLDGLILVEKKEHIAHSGTPVPVYGISWETATGERGERRCRFVVEPADTGQTV